MRRWLIVLSLLSIAWEPAEMDSLHRDWQPQPPPRPRILIDPGLEPYVRPALERLEACAPPLMDEIYAYIFEIHADPFIPAASANYQDRTIAMNPNWASAANPFALMVTLAHEGHHNAYPHKLKERDVYRYSLHVFEYCPGAPAWLIDRVRFLAEQ